MHQQKFSPSQPSDQEWRELAERAARERDPFRLTELVNQLCDKLDEARPRRSPALAGGPRPADPDYSNEHRPSDGSVH